MSGWFEKQLQKLRAKEQEYRAWLRGNSEKEASNTSDSEPAEVDVLRQELSNNLGDDEGDRESTGDSTSKETTRRHGGSSSPAPQAAHRRVLIQRAEDLLRRVATLEEIPSQEQRRRAEQLADRLNAYLQDTSEAGLAEQDEQSDEEGSVEKRDQDPEGFEDQEQSPGASREEGVKETSESEDSGLGSATNSGIKQALCEAFT